MGTTGWGYSVQGSPQQQAIEDMGSTLSMVIECPVHYPAYDKRIFECLHGVLFPVWQIEAYGWQWVKQRHKELTNEGR